MARVTKFQCDQCKKEVVDTYLEEGWLTINGSIARSWGIRRNGRNGDAMTDYLGTDTEFCSVRCLVAAFDEQRKMKKGPPRKMVDIVVGTVDVERLDFVEQEKTIFDHLNDEDGEA